MVTNVGAATGTLPQWTTVVPNILNAGYLGYNTRSVVTGQKLGWPGALAAGTAQAIVEATYPDRLKRAVGASSQVPEPRIRFDQQAGSSHEKNLLEQIIDAFRPSEIAKDWEWQKYAYRDAAVTSLADHAEAAATAASIAGGAAIGAEATSRISKGTLVNAGRYFRWHKHGFTPMRGTAKKFGMTPQRSVRLWHTNIGENLHIFNPFNPNTKLVTGSSYKFWRWF